MSELNLSKVEIPLKSRSMSIHESPKMDIISIKQIGDYILGEEIGSGAFGKVLLGKHILTEEKVAIKVLDKMILNQTPEDYELVKKEISILKLVKHKYIVQLYEILQTAQHIFIIMEYCEGKEILDYILTKNRLNELESLKYFQQLINCLFYLHSQNIAHRDIKIDNMLLDYNKDLKLIDFGLSTKYTDDDLLDQPCGTVVYAAPEVLEGKEYHGMLADVWSSGIVLYGMLAGYLPFSDKDDEVNKQLVIKGQITIPDFFSDKAKDLLKHMLDVNPMTRYTLQEIKDHPWFNMVDCILIPGIIIDYNIIPIDENIINICSKYNKNKIDVIDSIRNNKHDSNSALYYLIIKKLQKKGIQSISDMCSEEFIDFVLDENNLINKEKNDIKEDKKEILIEISNEKDEEILPKSNEYNKIREIKNSNEEKKNKRPSENTEEISEQNNNKVIKEKENKNNNKDEEIIYFSSPEKSDKETFKKLESTEEIKKSNSPIVPKNYDIDDTYSNKENKIENSEKLELKNIDKSINEDDKKAIKIFNENEGIKEEKDYSFEVIVVEDEKRLKTYSNNYNKILEKIRNNLENNSYNNKKMDIIINDNAKENNLKEENNLKGFENKEIIKKDEYLKENKKIVTKDNNSKDILNNENNISKKNNDDKNKEILNEKDNISENKIKNIIKSAIKPENQKESNDKLMTNEKIKNKQRVKKPEKINNKNIYVPNTTKQKFYFNEKSNSVLRQLKKNLTKQKHIYAMSPISEIKSETKKLRFQMNNKHKTNKNIKDKNEFNFSSRNSKNKLIIINDKIKSNQKISQKNNKNSEVKRKASNKIFNIINIINNNYNSTENDIKMKNYYQSPQKMKENVNITNLQKKFDEISVQHIKDINYNNIDISKDKISSKTKLDNERNSSKNKNKIKSKTNNITIIIQNKKNIDPNNINSNILKSIINFDNKNNNISSSKSKEKYKDNNNSEVKNKKNIREKNLESSVKEKRYRSPIEVRELSESPKQNYLNKKTRLNRIPWKLKKKGIDKKIDSIQIYNQYKMKMINPLNQNNSKIANQNKSIKNSFQNSLRSSLCETKKINKSSFAKNYNENKFKYSSPSNIKQIKTNKRTKNEEYRLRKKLNSKEKLFHDNSKMKDNILNTDLKVKNLNSLFSMSNILTNMNNTDIKKSFFDIKKSTQKFFHKNTLPINLKNKFIKSESTNENVYVPINLCCLFFKSGEINQYKNYLISKLKKNAIYFTKKKNYIFSCNKKGHNCDIQINKIDINNKSLCFELKNNENILTEKESKTLYYLKIYGKKETFGINDIFKKFILNLD